MNWYWNFHGTTQSPSNAKNKALVMAPKPLCLNGKKKQGIAVRSHRRTIHCRWCPCTVELTRAPTSIPVRHIFLYPFTTKPGKTFFDYRAVQILTPYRIVRTPHTFWQSPPNSAKSDIRAWQRSYLRRVETSQLNGVLFDTLQQPCFSEFCSHFSFVFKIKFLFVKFVWLTRIIITTQYRWKILGGFNLIP